MRNNRKAIGLRLSLMLALASWMMTACSKTPAPEPGAGGTSRLTAPAQPVSMDKNDYPVFPNADAGADPSVPAEQGGKGFTGAGWETNTDFDLIGDPHAYKGGVLRYYLTDFPGTLRMEGPEYNSGFNYAITALAYEALVGLDYATLEYIPSLATHWQISDDHMTFRFRINPNARFSDGTPVTSDDVLATYDFRMDPTLQSPSSQLTFGKLERPVAESKYIVSIKAKELNWRNFLYFAASMEIWPAHVLKTINGEKYITEYNYKLLPGTGPYTIQEADIARGNSITARRRTDYWAANARANVGMYNFDELRFVVVRDQNLAFEMFKKGEMDYYLVASARQWVEELDFDNIQRGLVQKRKIFNSDPRGFQGFALNTRRPPFDDIRVRKAFTFLLDRPKLIEKIMFNEYEPLNSYLSGTPYENPDNPKNEYNPEEALKLLAEAGWSSRDGQGRLVKNGVPLQVELLYAAQTLEPHLTIYQEDLRRVGITLNLRLINPETLVQLMGERRFEMMMGGLGGLIFPNPETSWHSSLADRQSTNNITGLRNARVDEICEMYDRMFDVDERIPALREMDGILANAHHYILHWTAPFQRVIYWNKFGTPRGYLSRTGDFIGAGNGPGGVQMWWIDPEKEEKLLEAMRDASLRLEVGPTEDRYWQEYEQKQANTSAAVR